MLKVFNIEISFLIVRISILFCYVLFGLFYELSYPNAIRSYPVLFRYIAYILFCPYLFYSKLFTLFCLFYDRYYASAIRRRTIVSCSTVICYVLICLFYSTYSRTYYLLMQFHAVLLSNSILVHHAVCSALFYSVLFTLIICVFYSIYSMIYRILMQFHTVLSYPALFPSVKFYSVLPHYVVLCSILFGPALSSSLLL